jgi:hypothetical protein
MAKHLTFRKKHTTSGIVAELLTLLETVTGDGVVTEDEANALKDWLDLNKAEQGIPGIEFLRTTVNQVLADGKVTPEEKRALYKAVERVLPTEARRQARERRTAIEAVEKANRRDARTAQSEQRRLEQESRVESPNFMVAGVTYEGRAPIVRRYVRENAPAFLARDPDNPYDRNAIEIRLANGYHIGFMPRDCAESVAPLLDAGCRHKAYFTKILHGRRAPIPVVQAYVYSAAVEIEGAVLQSQVPTKRQTPIPQRERGRSRSCAQTCGCATYLWKIKRPGRGFPSSPRTYR